MDLIEQSPFDDCFPPKWGDVLHRRELNISHAMGATGSTPVDGSYPYYHDEYYQEEGFYYQDLNYDEEGISQTYIQGSQRGFSCRHFKTTRGGGVIDPIWATPGF